MAETVILETQEVTFSGAVANSLCQNPLVVGKTYRVTWGADEYTCVAWDGSALTEGVVCIGNGTLMNLTVVGDEPFLIATGPSSDGLIAALASSDTTIDSLTVGVYLAEEETLNGLVTILAKKTYNGFSPNIYYGAYGYDISTAPANLVMGETYAVLWDSKIYYCTPQLIPGMSERSLLLGNGTAMGLSGNDEPFALEWLNTSATSGDDGGITMFAIDTQISHTVGIYHIIGKIPTFTKTVCEPSTQNFTAIDNGEMSGYACEDLPSVNLVENAAYKVVWDGVEYDQVPVAIDLLGLRLVGNLAIMGAGDDTGEPFVFYDNQSSNASGWYTTETDATHEVALYRYTLDEEEPSEPDQGVGVILKDRDGNDKEYYGVRAVKLVTTDGGTQIFTKGEPTDNLPFTLDFSSGADQTVVAPDGVLVRSAVITKPTDLTSENIRKGKEIAGVEGTFIGDTEAVSVTLDMSDGDQVIEPSADGKVLSSVTVQKPELLKAENIKKDVEIAGIIGTHEGGIDFDISDPNLAYFSYNVDFTNKRIVLYKVLYKVLYETTGSYDVTVPDKIGDYEVIIACI